MMMSDTYSFSKRVFLSGLFLSEIFVIKAEKGFTTKLVFVNEILSPSHGETMILTLPDKDQVSAFFRFLDKKVTKSILEKQKATYIFGDDGFFMESDFVHGPIGVFECPP